MGINWFRESQNKELSQKIHELVQYLNIGCLVAPNIDPYIQCHLCKITFLIFWNDLLPNSTNGNSLKYLIHFNVDSLLN